MKSFQVILTTVFILVAVAGVITFAFTGATTKQVTPKAVVWGPISQGDFAQLISHINIDGAVADISYEQHDSKKIDQDFVNALAEGRGPDIIIFPDNKFLQYRNKLYNIPYANFPERQYLDTYLDSASVFLGKDGVWAIPFMVDPLVMYWNKATFNAAGIAQPPKKWSELSSLIEKIVKKNPVGGISKALVAMGEYRNINNAKDILTSLVFQLRNPMSIASEIDRDEIKYVVDQYAGGGDTISAVDFYSSFSNPSNPLYTWNRSFPNANDAFSAGDLALYFGKASELNAIRTSNPNLYFDVAPILASDDPMSGSRGKATIYAMALVKNSKNIAGGFSAMNYLTNSDSQKHWSETTGLPPARRDLLSTAPNNPFIATFYKAAIQSETWLDPNPDQSNVAFQDMIESISTGKQKANEVLTPFVNRMNNIYNTK
jgi:ABC-type glycerol-3-phosphate transport system substrate-binding protein